MADGEPSENAAESPQMATPAQAGEPGPSDDAAPATSPDERSDAVAGDGGASAAADDAGAAGPQSGGGDEIKEDIGGTGAGDGEGQGSGGGTDPAADAKAGGDTEIPEEVPATAENTAKAADAKKESADTEIPEEVPKAEEEAKQGGDGGGDEIEEKLEASKSETAQGEAAQGEATQGEATQGEATQGEAAQGEAAQGEATQGEAAQGEAAQGEATQGEAAQGEAAQGEAAQGEAAQGEAVQGETVEGNGAAALEAEAMEDEDEDEDEDEEQPPQEDLAELMAQAREERAVLDKRNRALQRKIATFWDTDARSQLEQKERKLASKGAKTSELKGRYRKNLDQIRKLAQELEKRLASNERDIAQSQATLESLDQKASQINETFKMFKREIAVESIDRQSGKPLKFKRILALESTEAAKDKEVEDVRLTNIHFQNRIAKLVERVGAKEELADGLHMIDFEQLKIENQTFSEKIEARNDELHKLNKKTTGTVVVLTHVKEKLKCVEAETMELEAQLENLEGKKGKVTILRDRLLKVKKVRDKLREQLLALSTNQVMIGNDQLISDYEKRKTTILGLKSKLKSLQAKLTRIQKANPSMGEGKRAGKARTGRSRGGRR